MQRLTDTVPAWVAGYIGIPFKDRGRDRDGSDCWGLVRMVYSERLGIFLPSLEDGYLASGDADDVERVIRSQVDPANTAPAWTPVGVPTGSASGLVSLGDVVSFNIAGRHGHVGVVVSRDRFLHAQAGSRSCLERLDSVMWNSRVNGFWRYTGPVTLRGRPAFLRPDVVDCQLPAGLTIEEMLEAAGVSPGPYLIVHVGGREVPRERWRHVRPKAGRLVTVAALPAGQGGGKTALRLVATIVVIAIAAYAGGVVAGPAAAGGLGLGAGWGAATTAVVGIAGTLAVNALIRVPPPRISLAGGSAAADSVSPTISNGRNSIAPYGVVPVALGTYRWAPPYGAKPYTEVQGDSIYLRFVLCLGEGPLAIADPKIGDSLLSTYEGVEYEFRPGCMDDAPLSLYPGVVSQEDLSLLLTAAGSWVARTSGLGASELSVDVTFPNGLAEFLPDGSKIPRSVEIAVEFRKVGDVAWSLVNGGGDGGASPANFRQLDLLFRTPESELGGTGDHNNDINWSASQVPYPDAKPAYLPSRAFAWKVEGFVYAQVEGEYQFVLDSNDAADVHVDGREVASWYGSHGTEVTQATLNSGTHHGAPVFLTRGWHSFRARVECRSATGGAFAVGWRTPIDGVFKIIPQSSFSGIPSGFGNQGHLRYTWFLTDGYRSSIFARDSSTGGAVRRTLSWAVPEVGPSIAYEVRLRRTTPDSASSSVIDQVYWTALRTIDSRDPLPIPGMAKVAVRIKASDQLNGVIDTFTVETTSIVDDWDEASGAWVKRGTTNPASLCRRVLNGPPNFPILDDSALNLSEFQAFHRDCVDKGLAFSGVIDFSGTVQDRAEDIAAAGRGSLAVRDGKYGIVRDVPQTVPVQHFTPANSSGFVGRKLFPNLPHALRVVFFDRAVGYAQNTRIVPDDQHSVRGLDAFGNPSTLPEATVIEDLEVFGCTTMDEAFRHGRYNLAVALLRPEIFELSCDIEHLVCTRGDLVLVTHDVPLWGQAFGRITGLVRNNAGDLLALRTDNQIAMEGGQLYRVRVRLADSSTWVRDIVTVEGVTNEITLVSPSPNGQAMPEVGDLFMFGPPTLESRELVVLSVELNTDLGARLTLIDHAPGVHQADQGVIPPYDSGITQIPNYEERPDDPVITSIRSDDLVMFRGADGSLQNRILITLLAPSGKHPFPVAVEARTRPKPDTGDQGSWTTHARVSINNNSFGITDVEQGVLYQIRIRTVAANGSTSRWVAAEHRVVGKTFPPPDVQSFDVQRLSDGTRRYSWVLGVVPPDVAGVRVKFGTIGTDWFSMDTLHGDVLQSTPAELNVPPEGGWTFGIKMVDTSGNESVNALYLDRVLGPERLEGVAFSEDAGLLMWPGTKTNCHLANKSLPPSFLEPDDDTTWDGLDASGSPTWAQFLRWIIAPKSPVVYEHTALDAGFLLNFSPDAIYAGTGVVSCEVAWSSDGVTYSAWTEISVARSISVLARYLKVRVQVLPTPDVPVPVITNLIVLMRAPTIAFEIQDLDTSSLPRTSVFGVGDVRLPVEPGRFSLVRHVDLTFNGMGPGWSWELVDKDLSGPRVRMYNAQGQLSHAVVDAVVRGL